ncbi:MAG TPA: hypothetical protein VGA95_12900 [Thermodesulfobacteriota bacterium]
MAIKFKIKKGYFQDALRLMRISKNLRDIEGVEKAVAVMATEKAKFALKDAGLMTAEINDASGSDLVIVVEAKSEEIAEETLDRMEEMISSGGPRAGKPSSSNILNDEIQAINIGLEAFKDALEAQGVKVKHVDWQVPAKGDMKLINILKKMY